MEVKQQMDETVSSVQKETDNVSLEDMFREEQMSGAVVSSDGESKQTGTVDILDGASEALEGSESDGPDGRRRRRRRGRHKGGSHHRKWKPYCKLSWPERRELEEKESERANKKRQDAFESGHPVAPYNTTQFLIDDHIQSEASPDIVVDEINEAGVQNGRGSRDGSFGSGDSSDEMMYSSNEEEQEVYQVKEFSATYDNIHAERLQSLSKDQLIKELIELEGKAEKLEKHVKEVEVVRMCRNSLDRSGFDLLSSNGNEEPNEPSEGNVVSERLKKLESENYKLKQEIKLLKPDVKSDEFT